MQTSCDRFIYMSVSFTFRNKGETHMRTILTTLAAVMLLTSNSSAYCQAADEHTDTDSITEVIIGKKNAMLAVCDTTSDFIFSGDYELADADPHAYWLMSRMMETMTMIRDADDGLAWTLGMNENIREYSRRIDRNIYEKNAEDAAATAINHLMNIYCAGNQPEMNTASYVNAIVAIYRTTNEYIRLMRIYEDEALGELIYREYYEWFDLNNAVNGIMTFYTYGAAHYSALPLDINGHLQVWSEKRLKELATEREIFWHNYGEPHTDKCTKVSLRRFERLMEEFKNIRVQDVIKEVVSDWAEKDYDFAWEMFGEAFDFEHIQYMNCLYDVALHNWLTVREEIAEYLGEDRGKAYRKMTERVTSRLYGDLKELKEIRY